MIKTRSGKRYCRSRLPLIQYSRKKKNHQNRIKQNKVFVTPRILPDLNALFTFQRPYPQQFSIPFSIIKYIFTNPSSPKAWKKLILICKYFFSKNRIYPIGYLEAVDHFDIQNYETKPSVQDQINPNLIGNNKLWLFKTFFVYTRDINSNSDTFFGNTISRMIPKIGKCELRNLDIRKQRLTSEEFYFLTSAGMIENCSIDCCCFDNSDNSDGNEMVTFDKLCNNFQNLNTFFIKFSTITSMFAPETVKKVVQILTKLKHLNKLRLDDLPENFDIITFLDFIMVNENVKIEINFKGPISDAYRIIHENFIEKILANQPKMIPQIKFQGCDKVKIAEFEKLSTRQK